ncbi:MAG TPA: hypothetical protein VHY33_04555 [Thermoanaerobaculia bacterium]|jgi:hypothetical protein|nr:hypothetical protein [Thermoanaerobaculia bacterium]
MKFLLSSYIVFYVLFGSAVFAAKFILLNQEEPRSSSRWEPALDLVLLAIGLIGMLLLLLDYGSLQVRTVWKFVSVALVATQLGLNLSGRSKYLADSTTVENVHVGLADLGVLLFLMPSLGLNLAYEFQT